MHTRCIVSFSVCYTLISIKSKPVAVGPLTWPSTCSPAASMLAPYSSADAMLCSVSSAFRKSRVPRPLRQTRTTVVG